MKDGILIGLILILIVVALLRTKKYFKRGGCCGSTSVRPTKKLTAPKIGEKTLTIEGMHCENCRNRVIAALNRLDGVVCRVNLRKKTAIVSYSSEVSDQVLREAVEKAGCQVISIQ